MCEFYELIANRCAPQRREDINDQIQFYHLCLKDSDLTWPYRNKAFNYLL